MNRPCGKIPPNNKTSTAPNKTLMALYLKNKAGCLTNLKENVDYFVVLLEMKF